ncbi:hypothetical protein ACFQ7F_44480 [Streptomyces sp. NPDC056486]|uniref:hypothetical protein n=1 Tax=Streptomyces sp. NPDC056486 TaxID=3345835 RepID=UPI0036BCEB4A
MNVLTGVPGTRITESGVTLPPLEIRGYVDPPLFQSRDVSSGTGALFKASDALRLSVPKAYIVLAPYKRLRREEDFR